MENARLKQDLAALRHSVANSTDLDGSGRKGGAAATKFMGKFKVRRWRPGSVRIIHCRLYCLTYMLQCFSVAVVIFFAALAIMLNFS